MKKNNSLLTTLIFLVGLAIPLTAFSEETAEKLKDQEKIQYLKADFYRHAHNHLQYLYLEEGELEAEFNLEDEEVEWTEITLVIIDSSFNSLFFRVESDENSAGGRLVMSQVTKYNEDCETSNEVQTCSTLLETRYVDITQTELEAISSSFLEKKYHELPPFNDVDHGNLVCIPGTQYFLSTKVSKKGKWLGWHSCHDGYPTDLNAMTPLLTLIKEKLPAIEAYDAYLFEKDKNLER